MRRTSQLRGATNIVCGTLLSTLLSISVSSAQGLSAAPSAPSAQVGVPGARSTNVEIAQRLLARLGLLNEQATGVMTAATSDAIRRFASQQNLIFTNQVTDQILRAMRGAAWNTGGWKKGALKGQEKLMDSTGVREAQSYLIKLGFNPGPADGTFGPQTQSSVESFQANQQTSVDGLITKTALMNLKRATLLNAADSVGTIRILNWPDYIEPTVLEDFEKQTKIRIIYDTYGSNEELESKLKTSREPYDVAIPTASHISELKANKLLRPLDRNLLKNLGNIDPKILAYLEAWDQGAKYSVPYMWFTLGIASNQRLVSKFAPNAKLDSLSAIFDPIQAKQLSACGIRIVDSASDIIPLAALSTGLKKWSNDAQSMAAAEKILMGIRDIVQPISSDEYIDALAKGKICVAIGFSGDTIQARKDATPGNSIQYRVPIEGSSLGFDTLTIPANSKNSALAHQFIDYILLPQVVGKISNTVRYANGNINSGPFIDPALLQDPGIYPPADVMKRLIVVPSLTADMKENIDRVWKKFSHK